MKNAKKILFIFGAYYVIVGFIALFQPAVSFKLYGVTEVSAAAAITARWLGALAVAIGYGTFAYVKHPTLPIRNILSIAAILSLVASLIGFITKEGTLSNLWFDALFNIVLLIILLSFGKKIEAGKKAVR